MRPAIPASVRRLACAALILPAPAWAVEVMVAPSDLAKFAPSDSYRLTDPLPVAIPQPQGGVQDFRITEEAVGFLPDGEISRFNVIGRVDWQLSEMGDGAGVAAGSERSFTSYSATSTTVATAFAQRDARRRLMVILADRIVTDLLGRGLA